MQTYELHLQSIKHEPKPVDPYMAFFSQRQQGGGGGRGGNRGRGSYNNQYSSRGRGFTAVGQNQGSHPPQNTNNNGNFGQQQFLNQTGNAWSHFAGNSNKRFQNNNAGSGVPTPCQISGRRNHMAMKSFYRWNYSFQAPEDLSQALTTLSTSDVQDSNLYVDTGANVHVTNDPGKLFNIKH